MIMYARLVILIATPLQLLIQQMLNGPILLQQHNAYNHADIRGMFTYKNPNEKEGA